MSPQHMDHRCSTVCLYGTTYPIITRIDRRIRAMCGARQTRQATNIVVLCICFPTHHLLHPACPSCSLACLPPPERLGCPVHSPDQGLSIGIAYVPIRPVVGARWARECRRRGERQQRATRANGEAYGAVSIFAELSSSVAFERWSIRVDTCSGCGDTKQAFWTGACYLSGWGHVTCAGGVPPLAGA